MSLETEPITRKAYAKVNLTFEVLGKRQDGYHEVASVVQVISICDVLTFEANDQIRLACDVPELVSPNNLVCQAARLMHELTHRGRGVAISLSKGIPLASGLGGGSTDAAMTLQVLNKMWSLNLSQERLLRLAAQVGSDVPFFLGGSPTALATGRGEKVEALPSPAKTWVVLLRPPIDMANKTREMYAHLDPSCFSKGKQSRRLANLIKRREQIKNRQCYNVFDDLSLSLFPGLDYYRTQFLAAGASGVHLAGAGPTLFTLADSRVEGERIFQRLKKQGMEGYLAETI